METNKTFKLLIIEPWDAYGKYNVQLLTSKENKFLFKVKDHFNFQATDIKYLIGILRNDKLEDFCKLKKGKYIFNLFYEKSVNAETFNDLDTLKIRSSFFTGEMDINDESDNLGNVP